jgi:hypothetical protein
MQRHSILICALLIIFMFSIVIGCSDSRKGAQEKKPVVEKVEAQPVSAADQEAFRKKIEGLGIPMYKDATFVEVKRKAKGSPMLVALYEVPAQSENDYIKVKSYYTAGLKKALVPKGWAEGQVADNIILYRKGFKIFYVEFSRVIILPDTEKIRVAFQYEK